MFESIAESELEAWLREQSAYTVPDLGSWRAGIEDLAVRRPREVKAARLRSRSRGGPGPTLHPGR
ncbi:MAG: hypothetical protein ACLP50_16805 [Solirubrobacteraceae bacterium]